MVKISKKGNPRSFRPTIRMDELLSEYIKTHKGNYNETDIMDEAVKCFLSHPDCYARMKFEKDYEVKGK